MISFVSGKLDCVLGNSVVIDNGGIGYEINVNTATMAKLPPVGGDAKLYTYLQVREDGLSLFGFAGAAELEAFILLLGVSGIGAKSALAILSAMPPEQLYLAVISGDETGLSKAPGVGKKTAQRMILELKYKIKTEKLIAAADPQVSFSTMGAEKQDAIDALIALGYSKAESVKAVMEVAVDGMTGEQIIKQGLRKLNSR